MRNYQLKSIATDDDYESAIAVAAELEHRPVLALEEEALLELWVTRIEKYESVHEPISINSGRSVLLHLMDTQDLVGADLVDVLGSATIVDQILSGQQPIDAAQAQSLAQRLYVEAQVFL
jgi:HTH-type transcriptional regulator / antitoxin HigA